MDASGMRRIHSPVQRNMHCAVASECNNASVQLAARPGALQRKPLRKHKFEQCLSSNRMRCRALGDDDTWHRSNGREGARDAWDPTWSPKYDSCDGSVFPQANRQPIGSQYGEGFSTIGLDGSERDLDVHALNKSLRVLGAERMRHAMYPDAAFGMVFQWEGTVMNSRMVQQHAWKLLAKEEGLWFPPIERKAIYDVMPERAMTEILNWTRDWGVARRYAMRLAHLYREQLLSMPTEELLVPGIARWLQSLRRAKVPCAVTSSIDRATLHDLLERSGLWGCFDVDIAANDGMETISETLLSAAIKLERPPNRCISFCADPEGIAAAHNCTMKSVAITGSHSMFALKTADVTVGSMAELSVYNVRRIFANAGSEFMDLTLEFTGDLDNPPNKRSVTNGLMDEGGNL